MFGFLKRKNKKLDLKVYFIGNHPDRMLFTENKVYEVLGVSPENYVVSDDSGKVRILNKSFFKTVK